MPAGLVHLRRLMFVALAGGPLLVACAVGEEAAIDRTKRPLDDEFGYYDDDEVELAPDGVDHDSGAFGRAGERPKTDAGTGPGRDEPGDGEPGDGGPPPKTYCTAPPGPGDLAIVELMIASRAGSNDPGEWVEIQSTRDCWLKVQGVSVESPRGTSPADVAMIADDFELPPRGTFLVTGSPDPTKNGGLTGKVVAWGANDVLKNSGDTVTVKLGSVVIDALTYPAFTNLEPGRALSFPSDCAWSDRPSWARWSLTFHAYGPGLRGTPNAPNADVACF